MWPLLAELRPRPLAGPAPIRENTPVNCPNCTAPLPLDRVDRTAMYVRCDSCHTAVRLTALDPPVAVETVLKPRIDRPTDLIIKRTDDALLISQSMVSVGSFGVAVFIVVWLGILAAIGTVAAQIAPAGFVTVIVLVMATFGILALVKSLGGSVQRLDIRVHPNVLTVQQRGVIPGPIIRVARESIRQFWVEEDFSSPLRGHSHQVQPVARYALNVLRSDHTKRRLATFADRDTALYLEQEIEHFLNIRDRPVKGEVGT